MTDSDDPKKNCYLTLHMGLGAGLITAIHVGGLYGRCARPSLASLRLAALPSGRATARRARTVAWRGEAWRGVAWRGEARRGVARRPRSTVVRMVCGHSGRRSGWHCGHTVQVDRPVVLGDGRAV